MQLYPSQCIYKNLVLLIHNADTIPVQYAWWHVQWSQKDGFGADKTTVPVIAAEDKKRMQLFKGPAKCGHCVLFVIN